ncbi:MAG: hypothetical protein MRY49_01305 [Candidatus Pacebacteria bacterium]|nr:hypothetical protein [Candidatus Paceibacterota bacterium]
MPKKKEGSKVKTKIVDDVVAPIKRSIRDIPLPDSSGGKKQTHRRKTKTSSRLPKDRSKYMLWGIAAVSVLVLIFAIASVFSGATITIKPKQQLVSLNNALSASITSEEETDLRYQPIQISDTASTEVPADGERIVEQKASGSIVIFNNHSSSSQQLIEKTRFETPDGKIYRISEGVTVPGKKVVDGESLPGQLEVTVYADKSGEEYNIGLTDFTIPGFKGDPRYETFSAKSKTAMTGGFIGTKAVIDEESETKAREELQSELKNRLSTELSKRLSSELLIPEGGIFFTFNVVPSTRNTSEKVEIIEKGTIMAITLTQNDIAKAVVSDEKNRIEINNIDNINISLVDSDTYDSVPTENIGILIQGDTHLVWTFDESLLVKDLLGKQKVSLSSILATYESIDSAKAVLRPFWKRSFPTDKDRVTVKIELD